MHLKSLDTVIPSSNILLLYDLEGFLFNQILIVRPNLDSLHRNILTLAGIPGVDIAYVDKGYVYHTEYDSMEQVMYKE